VPRQCLADFPPALDGIVEMAAPIGEPAALDSEAGVVPKAGGAVCEQLLRLVEPAQLQQHRRGAQIGRRMIRKLFAQFRKDVQHR
jgi:hypothetical protein